MKKLIILILVSLTVIIFFACKSEAGKTREIVVIRDITDSNLSQPDAEQILSLFKINDEKWDGASFRMLTLTEVSYNQVYEISLPQENEWLGNEFERNKKIEAFKHAITNEINKNDSQNIGRNQSSIYAPLARELNHLSRNRADEKIIVIYSDLMENSPTLSYYKPQTLEKLNTQPSTIQKTLESIEPLTDLQGIQIHLIYQPQNTKEDTWYRTTSAFYKKLFESKNALTEISANLN
jgi:hypothetical protein